MDLTKMSVNDLHIQHRKAWTQDEWERSFACFDELARRLAAVEAERDELRFKLYEPFEAFKKAFFAAVDSDEPTRGQAARQPAPKGECDE